MKRQNIILPQRLLMLTYGAWDHASSRERAVQYKPLLETLGSYRIYWIPRVPARPQSWVAKWLFPFRKRWLTLKRALALLFGRWDILFVQRLFMPRWLLHRLYRRSIPIIYDFDDAIYLDAPEQSHNQKQTQAMVHAAAQVIVSSPELIPFCKASGCTPSIIPTPVDIDRFTPRSNEENVNVFTIGWTGSPWTTLYLHEVASALAAIAKVRAIRLLLIGADHRITLPDVPVVHEPWSFAQEPNLLRRMDVGIMPLPDDEWARGKGGYKLFLYMAAGLPVVASAVGVNVEIVVHGQTGFLAESQEDWVQCLIRLCDDAALRKAMGRTGRERVVSNYSRTVCFEKLKTCLQQTLQVRSQ